MQDFKKLKVWESSHKIVLSVYRVTKSFPREEVFGLTQQLRRAAISVPSNIAEGCGKSGSRDFRRYLQIAFGSLNEVEYQLLLARELEYLKATDFTDINQELSRARMMLSGLLRKVVGGFS